MRCRACALILALALVPFASAQESRAAREARLRDASLRAVQFLDKEVGWAVGDEGVILNTIDGGQTWDRKPTGLRASLRSVCFLNPFIGWVVGRDELPEGRSVGVLLYTRDGGETWKQLLPGALPGLNKVRFVDAGTGFVLGDGCEQFPSGVFRTTDAGRTWEPVAGQRATSWLAGDFQDGKTGVLAGAWSRLASCKQEQLHTAADVRNLTGRHLLALQVLPRRLLAAAEGGLVLTSSSAGASWGYAELKLPIDVLACLDFHAMHAVGERVWAVGRPGSVVMYSADAGQTWQLLKTGQPLPLHGVFFFDQKQGWAVGDAGTVLMTNDGGKSWQVQRQGGRRAAVLLVHSHARDLPVDTLAVLGANEGYLCAAVRAVAPEPLSASPSCATEAQRCAAAVRSAGGMTGEALWGFPLPQYLEQSDRKQVLAYWDKVHAGRAERELVRQLVLALRVWRPSVVLGDHPDGKGPAPVGLVADALQEAVRLASDDQAFPEQLAQLGLEPWQVERAYGLWPRTDAPIVQDNHEPLDRLGAAAAEHAAWASLLLSDDINGVPGQRCYRLIQARPGANGKTAEQRHWLLGVRIDEGDARRTRPDEEAPNTAVLKASRERRNLVALAEQSDDRGRALDRLAPLLRQAEDAAIMDPLATTAFAVGSHFIRRGQWLLARQAYQLLLERYPAHPLSAEACRWLLRHDASTEARHRHRLKQFLDVTNIRYALDPPGQTKPTGRKPLVPVLGKKDIDPEAKSGLKLLSHVLQKPGSAPGREDAAEPLRQSLEHGRRLAGFGPLYASDPVAQFCLQAAQRHLGETAAAREWYTRFHKVIGQGPWHEAAGAERWLATRTGPPRRLAHCLLTEVRPHLDGNFDDPCWQAQAPLRLDNAVGDTAGDYPTEAMFTYDQEYLYLALRCRHPRGHGVAPARERGRDAVLEGFDRVSILLDLDRDYSTYYHLQVDQRGCVREDCWGDRHWDPRWFVAVKSSEDAWHIEAAIPLAELIGERLTLGSAWALNVVRVLPCRGVQSWSQPADVRPRPEGMSLLLFQQPPDRAAAPPMPRP
jgi:photosystem II stability/assembly factor-like uncharacterized protein